MGVGVVWVHYGKSKIQFFKFLDHTTKSKDISAPGAFIFKIFVPVSCTLANFLKVQYQNSTIQLSCLKFGEICWWSVGLLLFFILFYF